MAICIIVLKNEESAYQLQEKIQATSLHLLSFELIEPISKTSENPDLNKKSTNLNNANTPSYPLKKVNINAVKLLNPKLSRRIRQKNMALWLMPFGFIAGLTFSGMTDLNTFEKIGLSGFGETIFGGFLGMGSGLIGSYFAAASVNPYQKDIENLRKFNEKGLWLLFIQTPLEIEPPWTLIQEINPIEIVSINEL